jgi:UDP:flavonoid glycosyltransferase YjiC (YdhE family)
VPRDALLARTAVLVYHGGSATTYQALEHAVPMIAVPGHFDQDFNARAVDTQGLGRMILPLDLEPSSLRQAIDAVAGDAGIADRLRGFQAKVRASRGAERVAEILEQALTRLARQRRASAAQRRHQERRMPRWRQGPRRPQA